MTVRLGFAIAAHLEPEILVVDEVLAVGDAEFQVKAVGKMHDVSQNSGRTVLFVSHNMISVESLCSKTLILTNGSITYIGETSKAINEYINARKSVSADKLEKRVDRESIGNAILIDCKVNGISLDQKPGVKTGSEVFIELIYKTDHKLSYPNFWVSFYNVFDQPIFKCNSETVPFEQTILPEKGRVICCIPKLQLLPGEYYLNIALQEKNMILDRVENAGSLIVETGQYYRTGKTSTYTGIFMAEYYWKVEDPE
jgi:lipopolysaccharide transport system ATP-binding protein